MYSCLVMSAYFTGCVMQLPKSGQFILTVSENVMEVFATGSWDVETAERLEEEMRPVVAQFEGKPWAAIMDGRRWVMSTPECQNQLGLTIKRNIDDGLKCSAYVLDSVSLKRIQLERTHPEKNPEFVGVDYKREYFGDYFSALKWLAEQGFAP